MTLDAFMTRDPLCVGPGTSLLDVQALMQERGIHHLLVVEDERLIGVISDRDVLQAVSPFLNTYTEQGRDVATLARSASEIMSSPPITASQTSPVEDAADLMMEHNVSCVPVVDDEQHIRGIVTSRDILRYVRRRSAEEDPVRG